MIRNKSNVYYFNPTCEYAVGNGTTSWQPNLLLQKMESDLALLPVYFSKPQDYIVIGKKPSEEFSDRLNKIGIQIPNILLKNKITDFRSLNININRLLPWGWSPATHKLLSPLKSLCSDVFKESPVFEWKPWHRDLYSKKFALQILQEMLFEIESNILIDRNRIARICTTKTEIKELQKTWGNLMVKAPWSSSGRGLQRITKVPVHPKVWEKILGINTIPGLCFG